MSKSCAVLTHSTCLEHDTGAGHPENKTRLDTVLKAIDDAAIEGAVILEAPRATEDQVLACHNRSYLDFIKKTLPAKKGETANLDEDTRVSSQSLEAALYTAGGAVKAVDLVVTGEYKRAFCAVRPPGHHALYDGSCGFCILGNVAIAAKHAINHHGLNRVAIIDFDVHHGNGTQDILKHDGRGADNKNIFIVSLHEKGLWPYNTEENESCSDTMLNIPVPRDSDPSFYYDAFRERVLPALEAFKPEIVIIAAGFDAHRDDPPQNALFNDPPGKQNLLEADYEWMSGELVKIADKYAGGRVVSVMEGGYNVNVLARCVVSHIKTLIRA